MNNFYKQPKLLLWIEALILLVAGCYPIAFISDAGSSQPLYYLLVLVYIPIFQFAITPISRLTGIYKYYSPMLLGYMANKNQIDIHSGSSFDYLFVMTKYKIGSEFKNQLLLYHLEGVMKIINLIEKEEIPATVTIIGTSYFFNERTIEKLGFEKENPSLFYRINLLANFVDLLWMYSIAKGHFSIPIIWKAKKVKIKGGKLVENKETIIKLHKVLTIRRKTGT
jgi:hypothetical protein